MRINRDIEKTSLTPVIIKIDPFHSGDGHVAEICRITKRAKIEDKELRHLPAEIYVTSERGNIEKMNGFLQGLQEAIHQAELLDIEFPPGTVHNID